MTRRIQELDDGQRQWCRWGPTLLLGVVVASCLDDLPEEFIERAVAAASARDLKTGIPKAVKSSGVAREAATVPGGAWAGRQELACQAVTSPPGMACIPGGHAIIGSDDHTRAEQPEHEVWISTFFIDKREVTNAQYAQCEQSEHCPKRRKVPKSYESYLDENQPAVPIAWAMAHAYCVWAGKRLPTEAEWEKAARGSSGRLYPWGDGVPSCNTAHYKSCQPRQTLAVGSLPPGYYGTYDMAGNGYEWVKDWASNCYSGCRKPCGEACLKDNPRGPCGGARNCPGYKKRILKGGSWHWPAEHLRASWRRQQRPQSGLHRLSFRCASSTPVLSTRPARHLAPREPQPPLEQPSQRERQIAAAIRHDSDVAELNVCKREGRAGHRCRDPRSYYKTNEGNAGAWTPYIKDLGGGYVGIGADQNYDLISIARSRWAWIFDYDPTVVYVHYVLRAVVLAKDTPQAFADAYRVRTMRETTSLVVESLQDEPENIEPTLTMLREYRGRLLYHYLKSLEPQRKNPQFGWLSNQQHYDYIRTQFQQERIVIRKGNLLTDVVMPDVAHSAERLGVPIRIYYSSNADDQWKLTGQYRSNLIGLPFDDASVVLRTLLGKHWKSANKWAYVVHHGLHMQRQLELNHYERVADFMDDRLAGDVPDLYTIRMPGLTNANQKTKLSRR